MKNSTGINVWTRFDVLFIAFELCAWAYTTKKLHYSALAPCFSGSARQGMVEPPVQF